MVSPGHMQSYLKQDPEDNLDLTSDRDKDKEEEYKDDDKKKQISSKLRKYGKEEETDGTDSNGRRISGWDRNDSRKRSGSDDDDYEARKESHVKQNKKKQEESSLEKLSNWYQDRESEGKHDGSRRQIEGNRERSPGLKLEKMEERDSRYPERRESSREKGHGTFELGRNQRRRWDEADATRQPEESSYVEKSDLSSGKSSDHLHGNANISVKIELDDNKMKGLDINSDRSIKSYDTEMIKTESDHRHRNTSGLDVVENQERTLNADENDNTWMRDRTRRDSDHLNRSRTPERARRAHYESENFEMEYERSNTSRWREVEKDVYRDDKSKRRDDSLSDKSRDWEGSKDTWKRRQGNITDKERKNEDTIYDYGREWELQRRGREKYDGERSQGRFGVRKDGSRTEAVKTSSKYGISNENYDVIEIQTKPFCYGKDEPRPNLPRRAEVGQQSDMKLASDHEFTYPVEDKTRKTDAYASGQSGDDLKDAIIDDGSSMHDQNSLRDEIGSRGQKGFVSNFAVGVQSYSGGSQLPHRNEEPGPFCRSVPQGVKGNRGGRGGRGRPSGRDNQQVTITVPMLGAPMGPPGMPPRGGMQPLTPNMSPAPGHLVSPGVFIPPFLPSVVWPGARGFEMNTLAVPPGLSPIPPGPSGPRFSPNVGTTPSPAMYLDQVGLGRGLPPNVSGPITNSMVQMGRGQPQDQVPGGWVTPRSSGPLGKAPSRGEQNDYSQNFVDTGMRPQNFIRELELTSVVEDYPKLRELIQRKDEIVAKSASPPMYYKCDLLEQELSPDFFGTKFDVILVDPPWEEYVHRAPGVTDHMEYWTFEEIMNLKIEAIADTPSFIFLWVGDGVGLEQGRQCLKKWGFRRCEDICWVKTNKSNATPGSRHDSHTLFQRSKEHCLMGIKGTVRRSIDGHIIHANIDTDVIIAEEPPYGSTAKPEDMHRIVEHFALGLRRLELFGEDHNIRSGWLTVGKGLSSSNFNVEAYVRSFADKDGKVWQGGGRNPPPEAPHLVKTTPEIEALRPKSPMRGQQQQQSASISLTTASSSSRRPIGNSPQNHTAAGLNQEVSSSNPLSHWASPMESFKGLEGNNIDSEERMFDMPGYDVNLGQANEDYLDFETRKAMHMM